MTEELKKEAEQDAGNVSGLSFSTTIMVSKDKTDAYRLGRFDGYLAGAEPREKRIAELEAQIEKMKCCEMCKHKNLNWEFSPICEARDKIKIENPLTCKCDKWEIKEND